MRSNVLSRGICDYVQACLRIEVVNDRVAAIGAADRSDGGFVDVLIYRSAEL